MRSRCNSRFAFDDPTDNDASWIRRQPLTEEQAMTATKRAAAAAHRPRPHRDSTVRLPVAR